MCLDCFPGFFKKTLNAIDSCIQCTSNCIACIDEKTCINCLNGYVLNSQSVS